MPPRRSTRSQGAADLAELDEHYEYVVTIIVMCRATLIYF